LDKLENQGLKQAIIVFPEKLIALPLEENELHVMGLVSMTVIDSNTQWKHLSYAKG
jgi:hypothetical protein